MSRYRYFLLSSLFVASYACGQAQIYQSVDAHGALSFSDTPSAGSQPYVLTGANISDFSASAVTPTTTTSSVSETAGSGAAVAAYAVSIVQPADQTTIHNQSPIAITISIQPGLKTGDMAQLMVDGAPLGAPQTALQFTIQDLIRGTHQVQARVVNPQGQTLVMSLPITLFKQQASVLLPVGKPSS